MTANGPVEQVSVAHMAEVRLRVCDQGNFGPYFELSLEHLPPGLLADDIARKYVALARPRMCLTPEAVHHRIHVLDPGIPIELSCQQFVQLAKRSLILRVIVARHAVLFLVTRFRS